MKVSVGVLNMLKLKSGKNMLEIWAIFEFSLGLGFMKVSNLCSAQDTRWKSSKGQGQGEGRASQWQSRVGIGNRESWESGDRE